MNPVATALASYTPPPKACMICRERDQTISVFGGGRVCEWCALEIPLEMLPDDYRELL